MDGDGRTAELLDSLLKNPELIRQISGILSGVASPAGASAPSGTPEGGMAARPDAGADSITSSRPDDGAGSITSSRPDDGAGSNTSTHTQDGDAAPVAADVPPPGNISGMAGGLGSLLSNGELMSKLPEVIAALKPALPAAAGPHKPPGGKPKPPPDKRIALLIALKPYMSPKRCEAIDYIIKINRIGDLLRTLT